jgi:hypothetical protein
LFKRHPLVTCSKPLLALRALGIQAFQSLKFLISNALTARIGRESAPVPEKKNAEYPLSFSYNWMHLGA